MTNQTIKDSGTREEFTTGSRRDTRDGKGRFDLVPPHVVTILARVLEDGSKKYGDRNWEKGQPVSRYYDSALRHLSKYWMGAVDEMHLHAALWNLMAMVETERQVAAGELPEALDDHPKRGTIAQLPFRVLRHPVFPVDLVACWIWPGCNEPQEVGDGQRIIPSEMIAWDLFESWPAKIGRICGREECCNPRHLADATTWPTETTQTKEEEDGS